MLGKFNAKIIISVEPVRGDLWPREGRNLKLTSENPGIPHAAVEQDEDDRIRVIRKLVHQVKNRPNKDASIADLQNNRTYNPFSEESKKMIPNVGKG